MGWGGFFLIFVGFLILTEVDILLGADTSRTFFCQKGKYEENPSKETKIFFYGVHKMHHNRKRNMSFNLNVTRMTQPHLSPT